MVSQKFCLTGKRSFLFESKLCALLGSASLTLNLFQDPVGCSLSPPNIGSVATTPLPTAASSGLPPHLGSQSPWSPGVWQSWSSDCLQHGVLETPKVVEAGLELAQIICKGSSKGALWCGITGCCTSEEAGTLLPPEN